METVKEIQEMGKKKEKRTETRKDNPKRKKEGWMKRGE
jgi:hypothetical protein